MAVRKNCWVYPNTNPTWSTAITSNASNAVSSSLTLDYLVVNFTIATTGGNQYLYVNIPLSSSYTVQAGDYMEYDIFLPNGTAQMGTDIQFASGDLRDSGATDQNGVSAHPSTNLAPYANGKWYHRKIPITTGTSGSTVGTAINSVNVVCEQDVAGTYTAYYKNYAITDGNGVGIYNLRSFLNFAGNIYGY